ncbi:hypothetical protein [Seonamhaeicola sediminis]|uniref:hypothetical protein n=1 Tax=Seonamhaeicola sediminis TaxID=2528206 RepID=UPI0016495105|nr:hypothetical protein [Seonamhaeicola sediminis]
MEPNLPELPTFEPNLPEELPLNEWKFKETLQDNLRFFKSLIYLTKRVFML